MKIELEYGKGKKIRYFLVDLETQEIWVDARLLPNSTFLCAVFDGTVCIATVGSRCKKNLNFYNMRWLINEWGGNKDLVALIRRRQQELLNKIQELKQKYMAEA